MHVNVPHNHRVQPICSASRRKRLTRDVRRPRGLDMGAHVCILYRPYDPTGTCTCSCCPTRQSEATCFGTRGSHSSHSLDRASTSGRRAKSTTSLVQPNLFKTRPSEHPLPPTHNSTSETMNTSSNSRSIKSCTLPGSLASKGLSRLGADGKHLPSRQRY